MDRRVRHPGAGLRWRRWHHLSLWALGGALGVWAFVSIQRMPTMKFHPARHLELVATYEAYLKTGTLLIKANHTGSWYGTVPGEGWVKAAGDDDPGSYLAASLMNHLTHSSSPYPGLALVVAALAALAMLLIPTGIARLFRHPAAGWTTAALPLLWWVWGGGTSLVGTLYGQSDKAAPIPVYALYGLTSAWVLLGLALLLMAATSPSSKQRVSWVALALVVAALAQLFRSNSGIGLALAVGLVILLTRPTSATAGMWRLALVGGASIVAVILSLSGAKGLMWFVEQGRAPVISAAASALPTSHGVWHPLYLGLSYPEPITGHPSPFGVHWSDAYGWSVAREIKPDIVDASQEYDTIIGGVYRDEIRAHPVLAMTSYAEKAGDTAREFGWVLLLGAAAALATVFDRGVRRNLIRGLALTVPALLMALVPPVLVMPLLYYQSEMAAVMGMWSALALGALGATIAGLNRRRVSTPRGTQPSS